MLEQKYTFHPDLKTYEKQKAIIAPIADRALQALMGVQYRMEKDDDNVSRSIGCRQRTARLSAL